MDFMKMVLFDGIQIPDVSKSWPSILSSNVVVSAHRWLYAAVRRLGSDEPRFSKAMFKSVPGTSLGLIF